MKKLFLFLIVLLLSVSCTIHEQTTSSKKYVDDAYYTPEDTISYYQGYYDDSFTNYSFFVNPYQYPYDLYSPWSFGLSFGYPYYGYYGYPYYVYGGSYYGGYGYNYGHNYSWNHNNHNYGHNERRTIQQRNLDIRNNRPLSRSVIRPNSSNSRSNYSNSRSNYTVPKSNYSAPRSNYKSAPIRSASPSRSVAPSRSYSAPSRSYSAPTRSTPISRHR